MSASREKKTRQDTPGQGSKKTEQAPAQNRGKLYAAIGIVSAVLIAVLLVWNSGFIQSRATAVTIDGNKYTAADLQYYYSQFYNQEAMYAQYGMSAMDYSKAPDDQIYNETTGATWHDHFVELSINQLTQVLALSKDAEAAGFTIPEEGITSKQNLMTNINNAVIAGQYPSKSAYFIANYGAYMTSDKFDVILDRDNLANYYYVNKQESLTYTDGDFDAYYQENTDSLDDFVYTQITLRATAVAETDAEGNAIEMTEEETATKLEAAKVEAKVLAEEIKARLDDGEDAQTLVDEYGDKIFSAFVSQNRVGSDVNTSLSDWAMDTSRKAGDTNLSEYEGTSAHLYYVAQFDSRGRDEAPTADVRHILISAGSEPTDEQYATAKTNAETILAVWESGEATEEAFAALAASNSADSGSASNGGLITGISASSDYVQTFTDWAMDSSRQPGETGIVKNTGSSTKGWHIMYYVGQGNPTWKISAESALLKADLADWVTSLTEGSTAVEGSGTKYVAD